VNNTRRESHSIRSSASDSLASSSSSISIAPILVSSVHEPSLSTSTSSSVNVFDRPSTSFNYLFNRSNFVFNNRRPPDRLDTYLRMSGQLFRAVRPTSIPNTASQTVSSSSPTASPPTPSLSSSTTTTTSSSGRGARHSSVRLDSYKVFTDDGTYSYVSELIFASLTAVDLGQYLCLNFGHSFTFQSAFLATVSGTFDRRPRHLPTLLH
jgi:hypothetical protein